MLVILFAIAAGYAATGWGTWAGSGPEGLQAAAEHHHARHDRAAVITGEELPELGTILSILEVGVVFYLLEAVFALVVSGYSGCDTVARQVISALNMNKSFYLPPRFALMATANDPGEAMAAPDMSSRLTLLRKICAAPWCWNKYNKRTSIHWDRGPFVKAGRAAG